MQAESEKSATNTSLCLFPMIISPRYVSSIVNQRAWEEVQKHTNNRIGKQIYAQVQWEYRIINQEFPPKSAWSGSVSFVRLRRVQKQYQNVGKSLCRSQALHWWKRHSQRGNQVWVGLPEFFWARKCFRLLVSAHNRAIWLTLVGDRAKVFCIAIVVEES